MTPGSPAAVAAGCKCPVMDNAHGRGAWGSEGPKAIFYITEGCPLHHVKVEVTEQRQEDAA